MTLHLDKLDRSGGNGSRSTQEDWLDENTTSAENEWSSAKTTFYYWEAPDHRQSFFSDLYDEHHGKGDSNRSSELSRMRMLADTDAYTSMLELPDVVKERTIHVVEGIEWPRDRFGGKSYEKVILSVCTLAFDEYLSSRPPDQIDYEQRLIFDDTFRDLMDSNNLGSKELRGIREQVRSKTDYF